MSGTPVKNFKIFRKLCGESALQNVIIITTMWDSLADRQIGEKREAQLKGRDIFFKPVLENGARMIRHDNTAPSAEGILRLVLDNRPLPLCIQVELVDEHRNISDTSAGMELNQELNAQIRKHKEEMQALEEGMQQAMKDKDEETRKELEEETKKTLEEIKRIENDTGRLASDYQVERESKAQPAEVEGRAERDAGTGGNAVSRESGLFSVAAVAGAAVIAGAIFAAKVIGGF